MNFDFGVIKINCRSPNDINASEWDGDDDVNADVDNELNPFQFLAN